MTVFVNELDDSAVIAVGYRRVLYGDHGPYLEFTKHQIHWEAWIRRTLVSQHQLITFCCGDGSKVELKCVTC